MSLQSITPKSADIFMIWNPCICQQKTDKGVACSVVRLRFGAMDSHYTCILSCNLPLLVFVPVRSTRGNVALGLFCHERGFQAWVTVFIRCQTYLSKTFCSGFISCRWSSSWFVTSQQFAWKRTKIFTFSCLIAVSVLTPKVAWHYCYSPEWRSLNKHLWDLAGLSVTLA